LRVSSNIIGVFQVQKRNKETKKRENVKRKKRKENRWKEINTSKVVEIKSLNLNLDLPWKNLEVKLEEIIENYNTFLFSNFQKNRICFVRVISFEDYMLDLIFLSYLLCLSIFGFAALRSYRSLRNIHVRNFMPFGYVLREIQVSKVSASSFEINFFWKW
jgi:hypothetical protein